MKIEACQDIGVEGFEPPTYCSQSSRASQAALYSVTRTMDNLTNFRILENRKTQRLAGCDSRYYLDVFFLY